MYRPHTVCRACGYGYTHTTTGTKLAASRERLIPVADFGPRPLANDFRRDGEECAGYAPLQVLFCPRCSLAQLSVVVRPDILYKNYPYVTSNSQTMLNHFKVVFNQVGNHLNRTPDSVLEIGSNDGRFLKFCQECGVPSVQGVEPDAALAETARQTQVPTATAFWPEYYEDKKYDVIMARHVFAHVDDWAGFVKRASSMMHDYSLLWIEAPYVKALLEHLQADTIYHEHLSYVNIKAIHHLLKDTDLVLTDVEFYPLHGGSLGLVIGKRHTHPIYECADEDENLTPHEWFQFAANVSDLALELKRMVGDLNCQKKHVCGFGASAKSSFWVQSCQFTRRSLDFICDSTRQKWFTYSPGSDIPIVDEGAIIRELPDYAVCFSWNYLPEILAKHEYYIGSGGRFIVPLPKVQIVP